MATATLYLSIDKHDGRLASYAGAMAPGYHAHLLEFGHKDVNGKHVPAYPFIVPAFEKASPEIIRIVSKEII
jgi:hypothetical protein